MDVDKLRKKFIFIESNFLTLLQKFFKISKIKKGDYDMYRNKEDGFPSLIYEINQDLNQVFKKYKNFSKVFVVAEINKFKYESYLKEENVSIYTIHSWEDTSLYDYYYNYNNNYIKDWDNFFKQDKIKDIIRKISNLLESEKNICPELPLVFRIFNSLSLEKIKVIILGKEPYSNILYSDGRAFSIPNNGLSLPVDLGNIYKKLNREGFTTNNSNGSLESWEKQGVFLLNIYLTSKEGTNLSHKKYWDKFIKELLIYINCNSKGIVIICFGCLTKQYSSHFGKDHYCIFVPEPIKLLSENEFNNKSDIFNSTNEMIKNKIDWNM